MSRYTAHAYSHSEECPCVLAFTSNIGHRTCAMINDVNLKIYCGICPKTGLGQLERLSTALAWQSFELFYLKLSMIR